MGGGGGAGWMGGEGVRMTAIDLWQGAPVTPRAWQAECLPVVLDAMRRKTRAVCAVVMGAGKSHVQGRMCALALPKLGERAVIVSAPKQDLVRQLAATVAAHCGADNVGTFYADSKQADRRVVVTCNPSLPALHAALAGRKVALMLPDECHGTAAGRMLEWVPRFESTCLCGWTATPFRSAPRETLSLFSDVVYRYTMGDALQDGVLVPMRHVRFVGHDPGSVDEECLSLMRADGDGPGIVSSYTIEDCERYAGWLTAQGWPALPIHSGHDGDERARRVAALRAGEVRCLVHVSLLSEGVDMPWLRWLCLRRRVQARVRFLQEIGRVLRVDHGKTQGVVMDPHLLLGRHGLASAEAIGVALEQAAMVGDVGREVDDRGLTEEQVIALDALTEYLSALREELLRVGVCKRREDKPEWGDGWRLADTSQKQVDALKRFSRNTRYIPSEYREPIKALKAVPWVLTRGQASDVLDVLLGAMSYAHQGGEDCGYGYVAEWPPIDVDVPESRAVKVAGKIKDPTGLVDRGEGRW